MSKNIREIFIEWWENEYKKGGDVTLENAFKGGWSIGFQKSEKDCVTREKLILDTIRPLVPNLDDIIVEALLHALRQRIS